MVIGINCGHTVAGTVGSGAVGYLNESDETREVGYKLMEYLRALGNTVIDCTDDRSATVSENLRKICSIANAQPLDMFLSIHFNSGGGQGSEAYTYGGGDNAAAGAMLKSLEELGFKNRGIKDGSSLYVVRRTNAPACLLEVCFVDTRSDAELYNDLGSERIALALCEAITGSLPQDESGKGDLTLSQYDELSKKISELTEEVRGLKPFIYNYIDDNMPEWARETVQKLVDKDILRGDENGLNLTEDMLRLLVINDRLGLYD